MGMKVLRRCRHPTMMARLFKASQPLRLLFGILGVLAAHAAVLQVNAMSAASPEEALPQTLETQPLMIRTVSGKQVFFTVEVADEKGEQRVGLMHRTALGDDVGMIFLYEEPRIIGMWMKNTLIPLDMVFMDSQGRVVNVHANAVPGSLDSIRSQRLSVAVLEIAGGRAAELGLGAGDTVFHCRFGNFPCQTTPAKP